LNPGPPAPQAGVIIRQHGKNPVTPVRISGFTVVLDDEPAYAEYNDRIIKTLLQMQADGRKKATIKSATSTLRKLNRVADLMNPESVKLEIANWKDQKTKQPASDARKHKDIWNYYYFVDDIDLEKIGNLIQQAVQKSSAFRFKNLIKGLRKSLPKNNANNSERREDTDK
jgi:hypothetical protein